MKITNEQNDIEYVLFSEEQIKNRVKELGEELTRRYMDKAPVVVCILKGASFFYTDLCRQIKCPIHMDFISVSSYGKSAQSSGIVKLVKDLDNNIQDKDVLIVEDIIDSGLTLKYLREMLESRKPRSIKTVCLLDKYQCHSPEIGTDMKGFNIEDKFVVGYEIDYADYYRNLPYIGVLKKECYEN